MWVRVILLRRNCQSWWGQFSLERSFHLFPYPTIAGLFVLFEDASSMLGCQSSCVSGMPNFVPSLGNCFNDGCLYILVNVLGALFWFARSAVLSHGFRDGLDGDTLEDELHGFTEL